MSGNSGGHYGGGIWNSGTLNVIDSIVSGNAGTGRGGAFSNEASGTATITGSTVSDNTAAYGGAIYNLGDLTIDGSTLSNNVATNGGGGVLNLTGGTATVVESTFIANEAYAGGGISNLGTESPDVQTHLTILDSVFQDNVATHSGGGVSNYYGHKLDVTNCSFLGNQAQYYGGGIYNGGTYKHTEISIENSLFSGNTTANLDGGAIYNGVGEMTVSACTISGNTAARHAGAIHNNKVGSAIPAGP